MAYGKREHSLHAFRRRLDQVLAAERELESRHRPRSARSTPRCESRSRCDSALLDPEEPESTDVVKRVMDHPELASAAVRVLGMMLEEKDLLFRNEVD